MKKLLIQTSGQFGLIDTATGTDISAFNPTVVSASPFINLKVDAKVIEVMWELKPEATQEDFLGYLAESEGDTELAVESFLSKYGVDEEDTEEVRAALEAKAEELGISVSSNMKDSTIQKKIDEALASNQ